jgi:hypothetical protein
MKFLMSINRFQAIKTIAQKDEKGSGSFGLG